MGNVVTGTTASQGGGIWDVNQSATVVFVQNVIAGNHADQGGGIAWVNSPLAIVNNTIVGNDATQNGSGVYASAFYKTVTVDNNLIVAVAGQDALFCAFNDVVVFSLFQSNDVYSLGGAPYSGKCTDHTGQNGNLSADPLLVNPKIMNYRLSGGSPAIDAGDNSAPNLPSKDFAGSPRIINGDGGPTAVVDMGAYEFVPVTLSPNSLSFGLQAVGRSTSKTATLTNNQNKVLNIVSFSVPAGYSVSGCGKSVAAFTSCTLTVTFHPLTAGTFKGALTVKDAAGNSPQAVTLWGRAQ